VNVSSGSTPWVVPDIKGPLNGYVCACSLVVHAFGAVSPSSHNQHYQSTEGDKSTDRNHRKSPADLVLFILQQDL